MSDLRNSQVERDKYMLPSERIKEILKTPTDGIYHTETSAILAYLDEQYEAEQKKDEEVERKIRLGMLF